MAKQSREGGRLLPPHKERVFTSTGSPLCFRIWVKFTTLMCFDGKILSSQQVFVRVGLYAGVHGPDRTVTRLLTDGCALENAHRGVGFALSVHLRGKQRQWGRVPPSLSFVMCLFSCRNQRRQNKASLPTLYCGLL